MSKVAYVQGPRRSSRMPKKRDLYFMEQQVVNSQEVERHIDEIRGRNQPNPFAVTRNSLDRLGDDVWMCLRKYHNWSYQRSGDPLGTFCFLAPGIVRANAVEGLNRFCSYAALGQKAALMDEFDVAKIATEIATSAQLFGPPQAADQFATIGENNGVQQDDGNFDDTSEVDFDDQSPVQVIHVVDTRSLAQNRARSISTPPTNKCTDDSQRNGTMTTTIPDLAVDENVPLSVMPAEYASSDDDEAQLSGVVNWIKERFPRIPTKYVVKYATNLQADGFDAVEILDHVFSPDDLTRVQMKIGHSKMLAFSLRKEKHPMFFL